MIKNRDIVLAGVMALALGMGMSSCKEKEFKINGTIEGGADRSVVLEKASFAGNSI
ncbi:MAG: hypothetical protein K2H76_03240 [Muribaculaceae bacterium]|nr:hypothetical protein [Muribaculaceae bacterium]